MATQWTENDVARLRKLYPGAGPATAAVTLGRSMRAIYEKAAALGLRIYTNDPTHPHPKRTCVECFKRKRSYRAYRCKGCYVAMRLRFARDGWSAGPWMHDGSAP